MGYTEKRNQKIRLLKERVACLFLFAVNYSNILGRVQKRATEMMGGIGTSLTRRGWESWACSAWIRGGSGRISSMSVNPWGMGAKRMEHWALLAEPRAGTAGSGHKLEHWSFHVVTRKQLQHCAGDETLIQAVQRLWGLFLGDLSEMPWCRLGHPALGVPTWAGAGLGRTRGPFPDQPSHDAVSLAEVFVCCAVCFLSSHCVISTMWLHCHAELNCGAS